MPTGDRFVKGYHGGGPAEGMGKGGGISVLLVSILPREALRLKGTVKGNNIRSKTQKKTKGGTTPGHRPPPNPLLSKKKIKKTKQHTPPQALTRQTQPHSPPCSGRKQWKMKANQGRHRQGSGDSWEPGKKKNRITTQIQCKKKKGQKTQTNPPPPNPRSKSTPTLAQSA